MIRSISYRSYAVDLLKCMSPTRHLSMRPLTCSGHVPPASSRHCHSLTWRWPCQMCQVDTCHPHSAAQPELDNMTMSHLDACTWGNLNHQGSKSDGVSSLINVFPYARNELSSNTIRPSANQPPTSLSRFFLVFPATPCSYFWRARSAEGGGGKLFICALFHPPTTPARRLRSPIYADDVPHGADPARRPPLPPETRVEYGLARVMRLWRSLTYYTSGASGTARALVRAADSTQQLHCCVMSA
ncbi:hypothetical protein F4780DRAFT_588542 [Xylariomycetidae sp. FL0641]|nr:hypothetical protein F4780DRAFT_588542 [Xylariomycetidae sp. FL0641]